MKSAQLKALRQAITLGALAGMRTTAAPLVANLMLKKRRHDGHLPAFAGKTGTTAVLSLMAAGELVGDKLPATPARIAAGGLIGRGISGALAGSAISRAGKQNVLLGAACGLTAALASAFACYWLRKSVVDRFDLHDPLVGAAEDMLVIGTGIYLVSQG